MCYEARKRALRRIISGRGNFCSNTLNCRRVIKQTKFYSSLKFMCYHLYVNWCLFFYMLLYLNVFCSVTVCKESILLLDRNLFEGRVHSCCLPGSTYLSCSFIEAQYASLWILDMTHCSTQHPGSLLRTQVLPCGLTFYLTHLPLGDVQQLAPILFSGIIGLSSLMET